MAVWYRWIEKKYGQIELLKYLKKKLSSEEAESCKDGFCFAATLMWLAFCKGKIKNHKQSKKINENDLISDNSSDWKSKKEKICNSKAVYAFLDIVTISDNCKRVAQIHNEYNKRLNELKKNGGVTEIPGQVGKCLKQIIDEKKDVIYKREYDDCIVQHACLINEFANKVGGMSADLFYFTVGRIPHKGSITMSKNEGVILHMQYEEPGKKTFHRHAVAIYCEDNDKYCYYDPSAGIILANELDDIWDELKKMQLRVVVTQLYKIT